MAARKPTKAPPVDAPRHRVHEAQFLASAATTASLPPPMAPEIAFAGRSNVGKSSLLNRLVERRGLVRTGSTPGTTRALNFFGARLASGLEVTLVDLPGYGFAARSKGERRGWGRLIEHYLTTRVTLRAVVLLVDVRRGIEDDDRELLDYVASLPEAQRPKVASVVVATKIDKVGASALGPLLRELRASSQTRVLGCSAEDGRGRDELWDVVIAASLGADVDAKRRAAARAQPSS